MNACCTVRFALQLLVILTIAVSRGIRILSAYLQGSKTSPALVEVHPLTDACIVDNLPIDEIPEQKNVVCKVHLITTHRSKASNYFAHDTDSFGLIGHGR